MFLCETAVKAQSTCFTVNDTVGCAPFQVTVSYCGPQNKPYVYDFGENQGINFDTTYTYSNAGTFTITQYVGTSTTTDTLIKENLIRVVNIPIPEFTAFACAGRIASITITDTVYDAYAVDYGDGSPLDTLMALESIQKTYVDTFSKSITITGFYYHAPCSNTNTKEVVLYNSAKAPTLSFLEQIDDNQFGLHFNAPNYLSIHGYMSTNGSSYDSLGVLSSSTNSYLWIKDNLLTNQEDYCFYVTVEDRCGTFLSSDTICNLNFTSNSVNNAINSSWTTYLGPNLTTYSLIRNQEVFNGLTTSYSDSTVTCEVEYCYQIKAMLSQLNPTGEPQYFISQELCNTAFSTDLPIPNSSFYSSIENNNVLLNWSSSSSPILSQDILENNNSNGFLIISNQPATATTFSTVFNNSSTNLCYGISLNDSCGNSSDNNYPTSCPTILSITSEDETSIEFSWTNYSAHTLTVNTYHFEWLNDNNEVIYTQPISGNTFSINELDTTSNSLNFRIRVETNETISTTIYSNVIQKNAGANFYFPTAFTPNGDNLNDTFEPVYKFIDSYELTILSRWGEVIFYTTNPAEGWNGLNHNQEELPDGVYAYTASIVDDQGKLYQVSGTVHLIKK